MIFYKWLERAFKLNPKKIKNTDTDDLIDTNKTPDILTREGGSIRISQETRDVLAILDDGTTYIAKSYEDNPKVRSAIQRARQRKVHLKSPEMTTIEQIALIYEKYENIKKDVSFENRNQAIAIIQKAFIVGVTDLRLQVRNEKMIVKAGTSGMMFPLVDEIPHDKGKDILSALWYLKDDDGQTNHVEGAFQNIVISHKNSNGKVLPEGISSIRIQYGPDHNYGSYASIRLQYARKSEEAPDLAKLGLLADEQEYYATARRKRAGLIAVGGSVGSGKTTVLANNGELAMIESDFTLNSYSIEDPVEKFIPGFVQISIATGAETEDDRDIEFLKAARALKRSYPHLLILSEVRDRASAKMAFELLKQGTQIWTTIHVNSVNNMAFRLIELGVPAHQVCELGNIALLSCQKLVPLLCECKLPYKNKQTDIDERISLAIENPETIHIRNPDGCPKCRISSDLLSPEALKITNGSHRQSIVAEFIKPDKGYLSFVRNKEPDLAREYWLTQLEGQTITSKIIEMVKKGLVDPRDAEIAGRFSLDEHPFKSIKLVKSKEEAA